MECTADCIVNWLILLLLKSTTPIFSTEFTSPCRYLSVALTINAATERHHCEASLEILRRRTQPAPYLLLCHWLSTPPAECNPIGRYNAHPATAPRPRSVPCFAKCIDL